MVTPCLLGIKFLLLFREGLAHECKDDSCRDHQHCDQERGRGGSGGHGSSSGLQREERSGTGKDDRDAEPEDDDRQGADDCEDEGATGKVVRVDEILGRARHERAAGVEDVTD